MDKNDNELNKLCNVYLQLDDGEKGKVIKLAEWLLNSQKIITDEKLGLVKNKEKKTEVL